MSLKDLRAKLSGIRSQVEDLHTEAQALWEKEDDQEKSLELDDFQDSLEVIESMIADLED